MAEFEHTPTPWYYGRWLGRDYAITDCPFTDEGFAQPGTNVIAIVRPISSGNDHEKNAKHIIDCVNAADDDERADLVKAKEVAIDALGELKELVKRIAGGNTKDEMNLTIDDALNALEGTQK